jgi:hypothetical protein
MDSKQGKRGYLERRFLKEDHERDTVPFRPEPQHDHPNGRRPSGPLIGPAMKKAIAVTAVIALIAVGIRFAWDQLSSTPVGKAIHAATEAGKNLFKSEDILKSGPMITGALIRQQYLPGDGRGYTHRVSYTDHDSLAKWTQSATFDAIVKTTVDTRKLSDDSVQLRWDAPTKLTYVVKLPQPRIDEPFWVSEPRDVKTSCNVAEFVWRFVTVNPAACIGSGVHADPHLRWKVEQDFLTQARADTELTTQGRHDVEEMVTGLATPFVQPLAKKYGFDFGFEFVWYTPSS